MNFFYSNLEIDSAIMFFENKIYILNENILVLHKKENSYYVYHLFSYTEGDEIIIDRWDHQNFPKEPIEKMIMNGSNTLTIHIENFLNKETNEESKATFKIFFTDKGIQMLTS
jgi:hypothetical protein